MSHTAVNPARFFHRRFLPACGRAIIGTAFCLLLMVLSVPLPGQPVRVMTEFARFTPLGDTFPQDRIGEPVEVLSPPLIKGAWNTFRIVVDVEPGEDFQLFVAQNPTNAMRVRVLREVVQETEGKWSIVRRDHVLLPFRSTSIPQAERANGRTCYTFLLEVQPPRNYRTRRLKLEPQLVIDGKWYIYPMEIRVLDVDINLRGLPNLSAAVASSEVPEEIPDRYHADLLREALCGDSGATYLEAMGSRPIRERERYSASLLARALDALSNDYEDFSSEDVEQLILNVLKVSNKQAWCRHPVFPREQWGPEWPAVLRNRALQLAGDP